MNKVSEGKIKISLTSPTTLQSINEQILGISVGYKGMYLNSVCID